MEGSAAAKDLDWGSESGAEVVREAAEVDWEIRIPRMLGGPGGGLGVALSHGVLLELSRTAEWSADSATPCSARLASLGWAGVGWEVESGAIGLHHPLHSLLLQAKDAELLLWTGTRIRWLPGLTLAQGPATPNLPGPNHWRLDGNNLYWSRNLTSHPPPLIHSADVSVDVVGESWAEAAASGSEPPFPALSASALALVQSAEIIPHAHEEAFTLKIGGWKLQQELNQGEVRLEAPNHFLRLNPTTQELCLTGPSLRLFSSAAPTPRLFLSAPNRSVRAEGPRLSINQTPSFFDYHANLFL